MELAIEENLSLRARRTTLAAEERQAELAWNSFIPSLTASGSLSRRNEEIQTAPPADPYNTTAGYSLSAQLTIPPGILQEIDAIRRSVAASRLSYEEAEESIAEQVRKLYFSLILVREKLAVDRSGVVTAEENYRQTERDYANGRVDSRTLTQAELQLEEARLDLKRSEASMEDSMATFKSLLGIEAEQQVLLTGELPVDGDDLSLPALSAGSRSDVARYEAEIAAQRASVSSATRSRWLPTLSLSANYDPSTADPFNPDNRELYGEWNDSGSLAVSLTFGLAGMLPFSQQSLSQERAEAQLESLQLQKQDALELAIREYDSLRRNIESTISSLESRRLNLELAREVESLTREAYESGTTDFVSLIEAQTDVEEARLALLQEAYTLKSSLIELEYAAGGGSN